MTSCVVLKRRDIYTNSLLRGRHILSVSARGAQRKCGWPTAPHNWVLFPPWTMVFIPPISPQKIITAQEKPERGITAYFGTGIEIYAAN